MKIVINPRFSIPGSELELTYARSSGPGGQNVNKVNSKAVLRWDVLTSPSLSTELRERLLVRLGEKVVISSDRFRDQIRNREDCLEKFRALLAAAVFVPKKRKKTKPSYSSQRRTQEEKRRHSHKKNLRRSIRDE